jgi:hypothetical protein
VQLVFAGGRRQSQTASAPLLLQFLDLTLLVNNQLVEVSDLPHGLTISTRIDRGPRRFLACLSPVFILHRVATMERIH